MSCRLWRETLALAEDYLTLCSSGGSTSRQPPSKTASSPPPAPPSESAAAAMRCLAQDMERQHHARFHALAQTFLCQCGPDPCASLTKVMEELVGDGQLNWGRVVSLFTFTGVLARQLREQEDSEEEEEEEEDDSSDDTTTKPGLDLGGQGREQPGLGPGGGATTTGTGARKQGRRELGLGPASCRKLAETIADYLGEEKKDWLLDNEGWEGFCKFSRCARDAKGDSSMKTALFAAAGVGIAGLTFLLVR